MRQHAEDRDLIGLKMRMISRSECTRLRSLGFVVETFTFVESTSLFSRPTPMVPPTNCSTAPPLRQYILFERLSYLVAIAWLSVEFSNAEKNALPDEIRIFFLAGRIYKTSVGPLGRHSSHPKKTSILDYTTDSNQHVQTLAVC